MFGCEAFAYVPKDERQKLDAKSRNCILLGHGTETKGYRPYNPEYGRVFHSRDVRLNESSHETEVSNSRSKTGTWKFDFSKNEEPIVDEISEPVALRRLEGDRRPSDCYGEWATVENGHDNEPRTVREALASPQQAKWMKGMEKELGSLQINEV